MSTYHIIPEVNVLVATALFLVQRGVKPYQFSPPKGKGIEPESVLIQIAAALTPDIILHSTFESSGPDVIGVSESEWWQIECKGSGAGKEQTQRNNFDRALSSVVSYYEEESKGLPEQYKQYKNAKPYLGLALPASPTYLTQLEKRVRQPLRKRLNLWVLLYEHESKNIRAISPENTRYI